MEQTEGFFPYNDMYWRSETRTDGSQCWGFVGESGSSNLQNSQKKTMCFCLYRFVNVKEGHLPMIRGCQLTDDDPGVKLIMTAHHSVSTCALKFFA